MIRACVLSNKVPFPTKDGSSIAMARLLEGLLEMPDSHVTYAALNTVKHRKHLDDFPKSIKDQIDLVTFDEDTSPNIWTGLSNLIFTNKPYNATRFFVYSMRQWLESFNDNHFDILILEGAFMGYYLPIAKIKSKRVVLRAHNLEYQIWERTVPTLSDPVRRTYFRIQSKRLKRLEENLAKICEGIWTVSPIDALWFKYFNDESHWVPVSIQPGEPVDQIVPGKCFHLGAMDWLPNTTGIDWFLKDVWPRVLKKNPHAEFHLAGNSMPSYLQSSPEKNIFVHGRVPNAEVFAKQHGISVIPLLSGSGMRIKILENGRWGIPMITTRIGCEGIYKDGTKEVKLSDFPEDFATKLTHLMSHPNEAYEMGQRCRKDILNRFGSQSTHQTLSKLWPQQ